MGLITRIATALVAYSSLWVQPCLAQDSTIVSKYKDDSTNITFGMYGIDAIVDASTGEVAQGFYNFGIVLPDNALKKDANEYIGILRCQSTNTSLTGWCGISHGDKGQMTNSLLLVAWPWNGQVMTTFRYATKWTMPTEYIGDAKLTQISSFVNETMFEVIYRCQNCFSWKTTETTTQTVNTTSGTLLFGRALAVRGPDAASCPSKMTFGFHDSGYSQYGVDLTNAIHPSYASWAAMATHVVSTDLPVPTPTPIVPCKPAPNKTYDYIIVGAGAAGIPLADRLSQVGKSVLLIEKGPPSSGRWGGVMRPDWLNNTNLTRFDVPGLCNQIWVDSVGVACTDTEQMEGCVLGGGTAVNAGLWWRANPLDWDYNFPDGWRSKDMAGATSRVFQRIPGTIAPSMDGKLYMHQGFDVIASGLNASGWNYVIPNDHPDQKNRTYGHTTYMFSGGERSGPMGTYLVSASQRGNFNLWMNTPVRRLIRDGGHITGVELECTSDGYSGNVYVTPNTGRVISSAGTFASAKLLLRSGIGPADQLSVVKNSPDGPTMINATSWIDLPVGYNLNDHVNTDTEISHPDVVFYDFYEAWTKPIVSDEDSYLKNRTGILAQSAPNIGPMFWEAIKGDDGIVRQLQWTSRVEGSTNTSMIMSQYLGRGSVSRGRMVITRRLTTFVSVPPYLHDDLDKDVVIKGIQNLQAALKNVPNITWITPAPNQTVAEYVNSLPNTPAKRRANHWIGTNKMGLDDGRLGGTAVVDLDTKVYGTDNLFVVDASIFPGHVTGNPSAAIVTVAERAFERLSSLHAPVLGKEGAQCGGNTWSGSFQCEAGLQCSYVNSTLSRCDKTAAKTLRRLRV
ncbi:hypothetical protein HMPREF1624_00009 [Sporothrix schenckii ATCC 58251]|uniref:Glucose-methanol-choline oxidoreductase N-terminal domain-containing protein n=1 Tax=Sporothrix schenckii (strain ATCC 58251 / de Perez 2211183) TaxID=1391915 RepID=U7Q3V9_SPOS1|nr:hypothetical protein HMPREF1624_00009 [Sporothrix schenckii ATCC 58251]